MGAPYPSELRARVLAAYLGGEGSQEEIADRFVVATKTVGRWLARLASTGSAAPSPMGGARRAFVVDAAGTEALRELLGKVPDLTHPDLCEWYQETRGVRVSPQTMSDTVRRIGYTRKRGFSVASRRARLPR